MTHSEETVAPSLYYRATVALCWIVLMFLLLPVFVSFPVSVSDTRWLSLPTEGLSLRHYQSFLTSPSWMGAIWESFSIGLFAAFIATVLGTAASIGMWRLPGRPVAALRNVVLMPLIIPPVASALALYRMWVDLGLFDTFMGVVIAHSLICMPFVVITVSSSLSLIDPRIEAASRSLGASIWRTAWSIIVPNIRPGIFSGALLAFIVSWDEIVVTLFVSSRHVYTLPRKMWDGIRQNIDPAVAAVSSTLILITIVLVTFFLFIQWKRQS